MTDLRPDADPDIEATIQRLYTGGISQAVLRRVPFIVRLVIVLVLLLTLVTIGSLVVSGMTIQARNQTGRSASKRISQLSAEIRGYQKDLLSAQAGTDAIRSQLLSEIAAANTKIDALIAQLRAKGITPVVTSSSPPSSGTTTTTRPPSSSTTSTTRPPSTTTTTQPPTTCITRPALLGGGCL